jgi:hypothetical protein
LLARTGVADALAVEDDNTIADRHAASGDQLVRFNALQHGGS